MQAKPLFPLFVTFTLYRQEYDKTLFTDQHYLELIEDLLVKFFRTTNKNLRLEYTEEMDGHPVIKFQVTHDVFLAKFSEIALFNYSMPWMLEDVDFHLTVYQKGMPLLCRTPDEFFQSNTYLVLMRQMLNIQETVI